MARVHWGRGWKVAGYRVLRLSGESLKAFRFRLPAVSLHEEELPSRGPVWRDNPVARLPTASRRAVSVVLVVGILSLARTVRKLRRHGHLASCQPFMFQRIRLLVFL